MSPLDVAVIVVYLAAVVVIGAVSGKGQKTGVAYFLADRSMHWFPAGVTMTAVSISAITFVGMPAQAFKSDWTFLQIYLIIPFAAWLTCRLFLPHYNRLNVATAYEYLETRFDSRTRRWASAVFQVIVWGSTGVVVCAPSIMLAEMTGFSVAASVLIVGAVTTFYTVIGGVRGVIYTDLLQAALFMTGWAVIVVFIVGALPGGLTGAWNVALEDGKLRLLDFNPDPRVPSTFWAGAIAMVFTHLALGAVNQSQVQKFLTVSAMSGGRRAIMFHAWTQLSIYVAFFALGTLLFVFYKSYPDRLPAGIVADRIIPVFVMRELPSGLRGLLIVAAFSAAMSTISSAINSLANVTVVDFLEQRETEGTLLRAKVISILWGVGVTGAGLLAWRLGSILELIVKVNSYFYGCLLGIFLLGVLTGHVDGRAARIGLIAGIAIVLLCAILQPAMWIWYGGIGCVVCFAVGYFSGSWKVDDLRYRSPERARH